MTDEKDVDLFAGPGGWDEAAKAIGLPAPLGLEHDPIVIRTRTAAGHRSVLADVGRLEPRSVGPVRGLIASPPCPLWSAAGSKAALVALDAMVEALPAILDGGSIDDVRARVASLVLVEDPDAPPMLDLDGVATDAEVVADRVAYEACLVLEPARWIAALRPRWVAVEQVPAVAPLWRAYVDALAALGYGAATGVLNAADYGVPQTRKRAILVAALDGAADLPTPTHAKDPSDGLRPWISMADAVGWTGEVGFPRRDDRGGDGYRERDLFSVDGPAPTLTEKARSWRVFTGQNSRVDRHGTTALYSRPTDEPAPTVTGAARVWKVDEVPEGYAWTVDRPATTLLGDPRVWPPGHKINASDVERLGPEEAARRYGDRAGTDAISVELHEAAVLQGFRPDYPWQGTRSQRFGQVGDAVPPPLAAAILRPLIDNLKETSP